MAQFTYDQFEDQARRSGLYNQFSAYDLELARANPDVGMGLLSAKNDWNQATDDAARSAANQRAEALRANAYNTAGITSYTGGSWGDQYNPILNGNAYNPTSNGNPTGSMVPQSTAATGSSFSPQTAQVNTQWTASNMSAYQPVTITPAQAAPNLGTAPQYNSAYTPQIDTAMTRLGNYPEYTYDPYTSRYDDRIQSAFDEAYSRDPFSYDYASDPVYQAYAKQYRREGERAMQNTLAQQAARTGGVASSAAIAAAQQANNYYNAQLTDKIPQLYNDAYNRYLQDYEMSRNKLNDLMTLDNTDYSRYADNRDFGFDVYKDRYNQLYDYYNALLSQDQNAFRQAEAQRDQYNSDANRAVDIWEAENRNQQWADEMARNAANDAWNAQMDLYGFGYDQDVDAYNRARDLEEAEWERAYKEKLMELQYGGGSSSSSSSNGVRKVTDGANPYEGMTAAETAAYMRQMGLSAEEITANMKQLGYTDEEIAAILSQMEIDEKYNLFGLERPEGMSDEDWIKELQHYNARYYLGLNGASKERTASELAYYKDLMGKEQTDNRTPVYKDATDLDTTDANKIQYLTDEELEEMVASGQVRRVYTSDGRMKYIYVGDIRDNLSSINAAAARARGRNLTD